MKHIIIEGYCMMKKGEDKSRPKWCSAKNPVRIPKYKCMRVNCQFFAYTDAMPKYYKKLNTVD